MALTNKGRAWKQKRRYSKKKDPRWSEHANRLRSEKLKGRPLSLEIRAEMSATRRNPGKDPSDPNWDQELWERDRAAYLEALQNRRLFVRQMKRAPKKTAAEIERYRDRYYYQLRGLFTNGKANYERLQRSAESGYLDDVLAQWADDRTVG